MSHPAISGFSNHSDPQQAAAELQQQLSSESLGFVLFFCSAQYDLEQLASALNQHFPDTPLAGCTTAGEITPEGYAQGAISAIGFSRQHFSVHSALIEAMDDFPLTSAQSVVDQLISSSRETLKGPIAGNSFVVTLLDGLSVQEEQVLATLNSALGNIPHFGGSAGDDVNLANTHIFIQGGFHSGAAVVLLFNTDCDFEVFTTHHLEPYEEKLVVTAADRDTRRVYELNAEPAAQEYARLIGLEVDQLSPSVFALNPLAVKIGEEYYVRSIQKVNSDLSLTFYCAVENGIVLTHMKRGDLLENLTQQLDRIEKNIGEPELILGCDCFLRRLEAEHLGIEAQASALLRKHHVIGFNTYGEQLEGMHINQTFTGVVIGKPCDE
ncbi:nitric oxide-sensing protein NosP [Neptunomonas concharum]|uniref:GfdT protein n=1 Tax=Neptunomonas concharum TaxID=1031538 RepID=A0A5P1R6A3_9GAMM|nr:nitric oxide-sensing protein NosP [Neptunomonas concharum]QEQ95279.1 GfdT protein [Neptunomonas concharum]